MSNFVAAIITGGVVKLLFENPSPKCLFFLKKTFREIRPILLQIEPETEIQKDVALPRKGDLLCGAVKPNSRGKLYYSQWFICSEQFYRAWTLLMYDTHSFEWTQYNFKIQETWLYIILSLIGNTIDPANLICGAVVSIRARETRFMIWTRKGERSRIMEIGKLLEKNLKYCNRLSYRKHSDRRRTTKALYC